MTNNFKQSIQIHLKSQLSRERENSGMNWEPNWTTTERYVDINDFEDERWAHIETWKNKDVKPYYFISNYGRLKSFGMYKIGRILPGTIDYTTGGYIETQLITIDNQLASFLYHQGVAEYFCRKPSSIHDLCVDHINCDKTDNRATNLQWITVADNSRKAIYVDHLNDKFIEYQGGRNRVRCKFVEYPDLVFNSLSEAGIFTGHNTDYVAECLRLQRNIKHKDTNQILHIELLDKENNHAEFQR